MKNNFLSKRIFMFLAIPILLISIIGLFPFTRNFIIDLGNSYLGRQLDATWWMPRLRIFSSMIIFLILTVILFVYTKFGLIIFKDIKNQFTDVFKCIGAKGNRRFFIFIFVIFTAAIFTIIRANYSYIDDMGRAAQGYNHLDNWSRFLSGALAVFVHASPSLMDISPLPQILACLVLAFGAFVFAYTVTKGKLTWLSCIATLPIGLSAYFLENLTFKFDAPYMALAVVFGIIPFLFINNKNAFITVSFLGLLGTCLTYQSASGVYIVLTIFFAFLFYYEKEWNIKKVLSFFLTAAVSYIVALMVFRIFFMVNDNSYASTGMFGVSEIVSGCLSNIKKYLSYLYADLGNSVFFIFFILMVIFCFLRILEYKGKKFFLSLFMFISLSLMIVLSFGAYLALKEPLWNPRAFAGVGVVLAAICMLCVCGRNKSVLHCLSGVIVTILCYTMLVFAICYGNTLAQQKEYNFLRTNLLVADLADICSDINEVKLHINNNIETAPTVSTATKILPLAKRLCNGIFGDDRWGYHYLSQYFHFNFLKVKEPIDDSDFPILKENVYHIIKGKNGFITVTFKQIIPQEKDY